ncbi:MAG: SDR family oxidoreductase [Pseudomonadota bacterium]
MTNPVLLRDLIALDGRVAVVTGAASGIGFAVASHLNDAGARTIVVDLNAEAVAEVSRKLRGSIAVATDVSDWGGLESSIDEALGDSAPDILVNAAGVFPSAPFLDLDEVHWDRLLDINLKGVVRMSQIVARRMRDAKGGGSIVHIGSVQGQRPTAGKAAYAASKAGIEALTRVMAREFMPHGIRVNAVAPGPVLTEAARARMAEIQASGMAPSGRGTGIIGSPDEIARVVHFLASPAASYVNGSVWVVDGGNTLD